MTNTLGTFPLVVSFPDFLWAPLYTDAIFPEPTLTTAKRLLASGHRFYCYRFDRVSPSAAESNFLAQHTAELRYLFGTLTADGYDGTDRRISAWMQAQWVAFARDGAPADSVWRPYREDERILVIGVSIRDGSKKIPSCRFYTRCALSSRHRQQDSRVFGADCGTENE